MVYYLYQKIIYHQILKIIIFSEWMPFECVIDHIINANDIEYNILLYWIAQIFNTQINIAVGARGRDEIESIMDIII